MHCILHIVSEKELSYEQISEKMDPYYESDENYLRFEKELGFVPDFHWDYWDLVGEWVVGKEQNPAYDQIDRCWLIMDPDGELHYRELFDKRRPGWVKNRSFDDYVKGKEKLWNGYFVYEINYHW